MSGADARRYLSGHYPHNNLIGNEYGSKMYSKDQRGYIYLLKPTPELWTLALQHRTEILYATDIALVLLFLELSPGAIVVESGTGNRSLFRIYIHLFCLVMIYMVQDRDHSQLPLRAPLLRQGIYILMNSMLDAPRALALTSR